MSDMDDMVRWADQVLDDHARLSEHLSDAEMRDRAVIEEADFYCDLLSPATRRCDGSSLKTSGCTRTSPTPSWRGCAS